MKIHYSPHYDGDIYLGDSPRMMGETYVGNCGLMAQLQLRAGRRMMTKSDVELNEHTTTHYAQLSAYAEALRKEGMVISNTLIYYPVHGIIHELK